MKIVIFAGGVGSRLWPLSRKKTPKQFEKIVERIPYAKIGKVIQNGKIIITYTDGKKVVETDVKKLYKIYHSFSNKMK